MLAVSPAREEPLFCHWYVLPGPPWEEQLREKGLVKVAMAGSTSTLPSGDTVCVQLSGGVVKVTLHYYKSCSIIRL